MRVVVEDVNGGEIYAFALLQLASCPEACCGSCPRLQVGAPDRGSEMLLLILTSSLPQIIFISTCYLIKQGNLTYWVKSAL
jgi:hypothetical protein